MNEPLVSVIIPAFRGGNLLCEAVDSVLQQSYRNFELLIVDDASGDGTEHRLAAHTSDRRVRFLAHTTNQGAVAARRTGLEASRGEIVAFLDQDDLFHPDKIAAHVRFLQGRPEVGVSYNGRIHIESPANHIRDISIPPESLGLAELLLGFPFAPSDTVIRRNWAFREEIWDTTYVSRVGNDVIFNGGEYVFCGRLALAGCQFRGVPKALNRRRYHSNRVLRNLEAKCRAEMRCQEMVLDDPRCPEEIRTLRARAWSNSCLAALGYAFLQGECRLGHALIEQAVSLTPDLLNGKPCELVRHVVDKVSAGIEEDQEPALRCFFQELPDPLRHLAEQCDWALARGYLTRGVRALIWNRDELGWDLLREAKRRHAEFDEILFRKVAHVLTNHEMEFGSAATLRVLRRLAATLVKAGYSYPANRVKSLHFVNAAFRAYRGRRFPSVPRLLLPALRYSPRLLLNRGVVSMLVRSPLHGLRNLVVPAGEPWAGLSGRRINLD